MVKDLLAATRYAQALFEIARSLHKADEIEAELESFSKALKQSPELLKLFTNPSFDLDKKKKFLQKIYQERQHEIYEVLLNFFTVLFEKGRFYLIHAIAAEFKRIADEAQGQATATLGSAVPLDRLQEAEIVSRLEDLAGYKIEVKKEINAALIGGVVVRMKNKIFDGSIKSRIDSLKKELTKIRSI